MDKELIDRAWACLPREFKEEVKKMFEEDKMYPEIRTTCCITTAYHNDKGQRLIDIFGIHNLTSDAEGEEELLTVTRSKLQELYKCFCTERDNEENGSLNKFSLSARIAVLEELFGSKCTPDEVSEVKRTLSENLSEPKPAEPKENVKMKPIKFRVSVYLATKEEDEEFRQLLHENGFRWNSGNSLIDSSCWSAYEEDKIHYVHDDKTVTYFGERTEETLTFTEFKKRYFGEDVNLSQETANCNKQFDNILKDSFHKHNRLHIAAMMVPSVIATVPCSENEKGYAKMVATRARILADALIAECEKKDNEEN